MTSGPQLAANRQNSLSSTGPRTPIATSPTTRYHETVNCRGTNPIPEPIPSSHPLDRGGTGAIQYHVGTPRYHARTTKNQLRTTMSHACAPEPAMIPSRNIKRPAAVPSVQSPKGCAR